MWEYLERVGHRHRARSFRNFYLDSSAIAMHPSASKHKPRRFPGGAAAPIAPVVKSLNSYFTFFYYIYYLCVHAFRRPSP